MPDTIFTQDINEIRSFFKIHKKVILKPIHSYSGNDIHLLNKFNLKIILKLHALQHRGQEGCGIVTFDGEKYYSEKRFGLVGDNFNKEKVLKNLKGNHAIGHNRYSTTGENTLRNIQPFFADTNCLQNNYQQGLYLNKQE